ncbi:hypothetical protein JKP88DRAFT_316589 [Tribonema minus]|uniref:Guanylate-binding protein N-terminal domain-containing protein n=1 Tax=Tribonema minus TaxID=303371 RepID=A0A836CEI3_9STRA|nr:hypothetical protein JKP88DRAFT_316589 [Tribonema minus]
MCLAGTPTASADGAASPSASPGTRAKHDEAVPAAVPLLRLSRGTSGKEELKLQEDGLDALQHVPAADAALPLRLVTILGAARQGKSFLMNYLQGSDSFTVSGAVAPCTCGVDISSAALTVAAFANGHSTSRLSVDSSPPTEGGLVMVADVEGQGDKNNGYDLKLAVPMLLLSNVVLFNWLGMPNKDTMVNQLALMKAAADIVDRSNRKNAFGHLVVVLRDCTSSRHECFDIIFGMEASGCVYLPLPDSVISPEDADTDKAEAAMRDRNCAREALKRAFTSTALFTLPVPHPEATRRGALPISDATQDFVDAAEGLRAHIVSCLARPPHAFGNEVITSAIACGALPGIVKAVNDGAKDLSPPTIVEALHMSRAPCTPSIQWRRPSNFKFNLQCMPSLAANPRRSIEDARAAALDHFTAALNDLETGLHPDAPVRTEADVDTVLTELSAVAMARFVAGTRAAAASACAAAAARQLAARGALAAALAAACAAVRAQQAALRAELGDAVRFALEAAVAALFPASAAADDAALGADGLSDAALDAHWRAATADAHARFAAARDAIVPDAALRAALPQPACAAAAAAATLEGFRSDAGVGRARASLERANAARRERAAAQTAAARAAAAEAAAREAERRAEEAATARKRAEELQAEAERRAAANVGNGYGCGGGGGGGGIMYILAGDGYGSGGSGGNGSGGGSGHGGGSGPPCAGMVPKFFKGGQKMGGGGRAGKGGAWGYGWPK